MDKRDELVCSALHAAIFLLKKHHFRPYFQKIFRGATAPRTPQMARPPGPPNGSAFWPRWCFSPADLEGVSEKINKRDEFVYNVLYLCSNVSSKMLKIALKKHHFKPYFQKLSGGPRPPGPPKWLGPLASVVSRRKWIKGVNKCTMYYMQQYFF